MVVNVDLFLLILLEDFLDTFKVTLIYQILKEFIILITRSL